METSRNIFPDSMIFCRIAEESYLALRKLKNKNKLGPKDKKAIRNAVDFLNIAIRGDKVCKDLELGQDALSASYAFKEAFSAGYETYKEAEVDKILKIWNKIIDTLKTIEQEGKFDPDDIDNLIRFFSIVRKNTLETTAGNFDTSTVWGNM